MSRLNQILIVLAMAIQLLFVCGDLTAPAEQEGPSAREVERLPPEPPVPPAPAPFVACYEQAR